MVGTAPRGVTVRTLTIVRGSPAPLPSVDVERVSLTNHSVNQVNGTLHQENMPVQYIPS